MIDDNYHVETIGRVGDIKDRINEMYKKGWRVDKISQTESFSSSVITLVIYERMTKVPIRVSRSDDVQA